MDTKKLVVIGWVCVAAIVWLPTGLWAAQPKAQQEVELEGTVGALMPGGIQLKTLTGQAWMFRIAPKAQVHIMGTAKKSFLQPGLLVEFKAILDQKLHATTKVTALTICSPSPQKFPGIFPEAGGLQIPEQPGQNPKKKEAPGPGNYHVVGLLMGVKDGQYSVRTPQGLVVFDVDDEAEIKVELTTPADLRYVRAGDQLQIKGVAFQPGMGEAREVMVKLLTVLGGPETSRPKKKPDRKTTEKSEELSPEPEKSPQKTAPGKTPQQHVPAKE